jgi:succinate-semialdehyde dehydrogenase/glutarate-semialdehyde dehydrogenase
MPFDSINPATGEVVERFEEDAPAAVEAALGAAEGAFRVWRERPVEARAALVRAAGRVLREDSQRLAQLITREVGKPIRQSLAEVGKCALVCEWYADRAGRLLAPRPEDTEAHETRVRHDPLGPVLAVMPWNFPFWQVFRFAAPALAAGNVALLKHASNVPACARAIHEVFRAAGLLPGVFTTLMLPSSAVEAVIRDPRVAAVTLTGSEAAGRQVGAAAGAALKKSVLELGGSDPFIVLKDADLEKAALVAAQARTLNSGQSCIAAKRFLVEQAVAAQFLELFEENLRGLKVGDPQEESTDVGPLARPDLRDELHRQVVESVALGARLRLGGKVPPGPGAFYPVTLLDQVRPGMPVWEEETFGPAAPVLEVASADEAVALANRSRYGLGASVWTSDHDLARDVARHLEVGCVFVNAMVKSDPRVPFGGIKASGHGRELSQEGILEFVNVKTVWIGGPGGATAAPR